MGCFSFNGNKMITCGGGGMVVTDDDVLAARARHLATQAKIAGSEYAHDEVGYNYRLTNLLAAVGLSQLERLPEFLRSRRAIAGRYDREFEAQFASGALVRGPQAAWAEPSHWLYSVRVPWKSTQLLSALQADGIEGRRIWTPMHQQAPFRGARTLGRSRADGLHSEAISLPSSASLSEGQQLRVIDCVRRVLR
jgi:dTDP-4-amino-4,6-dideoxygalactose transaminase